MEKVLIPEVLKRFSESLLEKQKPYISIEATPLDCDLGNDSLGLQQSKFLGKPFVPEGMAYPEDMHGNPLVLIAQINFSEIPAIEGLPSEGLLQLFFSPSEWWDMNGGEKIIYINGDDLNKAARVDVPLISAESYEELPIWKVHKLAFKKAIDTGSSEDSQFSFDFGGKDYWDFEEGLNEEDKKSFNNYFSGEGHKIGGYAYFTQGDPRDYGDGQKNDVQLLQIDTDEEIMFGDSGIGHIFISPDNLEKKDFSKAYFYWDCC